MNLCLSKKTIGRLVVLAVLVLVALAAGCVGQDPNTSATLENPLTLTPTHATTLSPSRTPSPKLTLTSTQVQPVPMATSPGLPTMTLTTISLPPYVTPISMATIQGTHAVFFTATAIAIHSDPLVLFTPTQEIWNCVQYGTVSAPNGLFIRRQPSPTGEKQGAMSQGAEVWFEPINPVFRDQDWQWIMITGFREPNGLLINTRGWVAVEYINQKGATCNN